MIGRIGELYHLKGTNPAKALDTACREFESIFAYQLMKVMGNSVPEGGLFEKGLASDLYRDMLFQNVGQALADSGALGIGRMLKSHVEHYQAAQANSGSVRLDR
ncbi:MAG TPA: rod-binding protein [Deltaproteobacteria bacterium]|jgi:flagellar protein FlgJ|nr:rod-binding protein [Deltaproteobacteria bacterium]HOI08578.1 rod-binding protein [Deltaproteobacteria bacterium]